jgi:lysozyme family protein
MANYERAFIYVMSLEDAKGSGVVTNTVGDAGGRTRFGIAEQWAVGLPSDFYTTDRNTALADAKAYYFRMYWQRVCGDDLNNDKVAAQFFSIAVNIGCAPAVRLMQYACGADPDGVCGGQTVALINGAEPIMLLSRFNAGVMDYYRHLAGLHPDEQKFLQGWLNRVTSIYRFPVPAFSV